MKSSERLAIAIDVGTTTIAASLLDVSRGLRLADAGALNPQRDFGADVVSRLDAACASPEALGTMARLVNAELERLVDQLLESAGVSFEDISAVAIAGNPAMEHLLLGLPVKSLAFPPYRPLFVAGQRVNTATLGWRRETDTYIFPLPGGFVGGDLVAFLYGIDLPDSRSPRADRSPSPGEGPDLGPRLFLDLGTNGEIALAVEGRIYATSAAAGPAFEGGNLACGMVALPGAINEVQLEGDRLNFTVIGGGRPEGICGSAVIGTITGLVGAGVVDSTGRLRRPAEITSNLANRVTEIDGEAAFVLYRDAQRVVYLSQQDIRQVQLAKGALRAGIEVVLDRAGSRWEAVQEVVVTGSFGARLSLDQLKKIGILPGKVVEICSFVREGALAGVERALCSPSGTDFVDRLAASIKVVPLSGTPAFEKHFLEQMNFPTAT